MTDKQYTWHKIADSVAEIPFGSNGLTELTVNGKTICVGLQNDTVSACAHKCPHAGGHLAEGFFDAAGNIVCPLHRYRYNMQNGRNVSGEGYYLKTFPVEIRDGAVFIGIADHGLFGLFK